MLKKSWQFFSLIIGLTIAPENPLQANPFVREKLVPVTRITNQMSAGATLLT